MMVVIGVPFELSSEELVTGLSGELKTTVWSRRRRGTGSGPSLSMPPRGFDLAPIRGLGVVRGRRRDRAVLVGSMFSAAQRPMRTATRRY